MSGTTLKLIAFFLMILDHIYQFLGGCIILTFLGRLSAPVFLFLVIEGYHYTRNKEKYIIRLYLFSIIMGIIDALLNYLVIRDNTPVVFNNIFALFFVICSILYVLDNTTQRKNLFIKYNVFLQPFFMVIVAYAYNNKKLAIFLNALFPTAFFAEGGLIFVIIGILLYYFRNNIVARDISYIVVSLSYFPLFNIINGDVSVFLQRYQWMMIFSIIFFHLYNNKRGRGYKYFFYLGYPLHIIILNLLSLMQ